MIVKKCWTESDAFESLNIKWFIWISNQRSQSMFHMNMTDSNDFQCACLRFVSCYFYWLCDLDNILSLLNEIQQVFMWLEMMMFEEDNTDNKTHTHINGLQLPIARVCNEFHTWFWYAIQTDVCALPEINLFRKRWLISPERQDK